ncbi:helix-turn-helix transcriptional regulator [Thalassotalea eurytherma]|uniref:HTH-type transcriptional regulator VirS n=1 Tax=Thalassotalea eurytherma TaxID=1144278 RepID=A0ABQ6GY71_9GAMM|nr:helix-turn-helix transcriptional regulator [Thalassotalea eurytherma]GLX80609.1 HTH-type transcriptional regulator VirS [Thalassotalea eurytherma]
MISIRHIQLPITATAGLDYVLKSYGSSLIELLTELKLTYADFYIDDKTVDGLVFNDVIEQAAYQFSNANLGIELAKYQSFEILNTASPDITANCIGDIVEQMMSRLAIHSPALAVHIMGEDPIGICYEISTSAFPSSYRRRHLSERQVTELGLAICVYEFKALLGALWQPAYCLFRHSSPSTSGLSKSVFGGNVFYQQDVNGVFLSKDDWYRQFDSSSTRLAEAFTQREQPLPLVYQVQRTVKSLFSYSKPTLATTAEYLSLCRRTLQFQLQREGQTFQRVLDGVRLDLANYYLATTPLSIAAVSERLHFSESAVFTRFIKKHTGLTPKQYRRLLKDGID